jgi:hypothetical protein
MNERTKHICIINYGYMTKKIVFGKLNRLKNIPLPDKRFCE